MLLHLAPPVSQDLSVAGLRKGLKHEDNGDEETTRSGLFMEAIRIIKEMRKATNGEFPKFCCWENVPGAFSSNGGQDFRTVLEELIKIVEPGAVMPPVPKNGWPYADCYCGEGWSLAYRTFDAQYWGVPQRRRRIYLVLDLGGERAGKILFEREGLRGYFAEGRTPWQGTSADAENCPGADDRKGAIPYTLKIRSGCDGGGKGALIQTNKSAKLATNNDQYLFVPVALESGIAKREGGHIYEGVSGTLPNAGDNQMAVAYSFDSLASNSMKSSNPHSGCRQTEVAKTLDCFDPNPAKNQGGIAIVESVAFVQNQRDEVRDPVYCLQGNGIDRTDTAGCNGKGVKEDICYTLNTIDRPAVAYCINGDIAGTLDASYYKGCGMRQGVEREVVAYCIGSDQLNQITMAEQANTLDCMHDQQAVVYHEEVSVRYIVRRLTPTECSRLQGFADRWAVPVSKDDFTDEEYAFWLNVRNTHAEINGKATKEYTKEQMLKWYNGLHTDSSEYKLWGNGIALPNALYVMQGIADVLNQ